MMNPASSSIGEQPRLHCAAFDPASVQALDHIARDTPLDGHIGDNQAIASSPALSGRPGSIIWIIEKL
jgi:hypothetical protein